MTETERTLLLTVARILRTMVREQMAYSDWEDDLAAIGEALAPFEAKADEPINHKGVPI